MTISSGGYIPLNQPQPSIFELQTTGRQDLQNAADIGRANVVIVPQSQADNIPFSKLFERNTWNYKSEADRPTLVPLSILFGAGPDIEVKDNAWEAEYGLLKDQLPEEIQKQLAQVPPTPMSESLKVVLEIGAKAIAWQKTTEIYLTTENAVNRATSNEAFPVYAYSNGLVSLRQMADSAENWLDDAGPNEPYYGEVKEFVQAMKVVLKEIK